MKIKLITLIVVVLLSACSKEIELKQLQTRGNLVYEVNATSPFTGAVKEQYDNGQVKLKSTYKKGEKNGTHVEYYENGELKFNATYKSGKLEGKYEEYFPNQIVKKSGELVNGVGSEFHYNKDSELYKTISYENHVVTFEKFEDVNYSYIEMINLSGLPYPEDEKLKSNFLSNLDNYAARVFDLLVFDFNACSSGEKVRYPSGKIMCTTDKKTNFYYPNGNVLAKFGSTTEEYFTVSGKSCGEQISTGEGDEKFIVFDSNCTINWEIHTFESKDYLYKYHNQTIDGFIKPGHYSCYDGNLDEIYSGTDADCLEILKKRQEKERKEEIDRQKKQQKKEEEDRRLREERARELAEVNRDGETANSYLRSITARLSQSWNRPKSARRGMETLIEFRLVPTGRIVGLEILESSGDSAFDMSVKEAAHKASPFTELQNLDPRIFEKYFRSIKVVFNPEDLRH
ncbi:TonB family protein [Porticoccaceae bacterium]|nr:TonB family protein [Porticoccaceae bacterium]